MTVTTKGITKMTTEIQVHTNSHTYSVKVGEVYATKRGNKVFEVRTIITAGFSKSGHYVKDSIKMAEVGTESGTITCEFTPKQFARFFIL